MAVGRRGGYGNVGYGRSQCGNASSDVEPRFSASIPGDGQINVPTDAPIKFEVYLYSSFVELDRMRLRISEDGGDTWNPAFDGTSFQAPYTGRIRRPDAQRIWIYIQKTGFWPLMSEIQIECTAPDEFDQPATKNIPVRWPR